MLLAEKAFAVEIEGLSHFVTLRVMSDSVLEVEFPILQGVEITFRKRPNTKIFRKDGVHLPKGSERFMPDAAQRDVAKKINEWAKSDEGLEYLSRAENSRIDIALRVKKFQIETLSKRLGKLKKEVSALESKKLVISINLHRKGKTNGSEKEQGGHDDREEDRETVSGKM